MRRTHIGLPTTDLQAATRFYRALLGEAPARVKTDYTQFLTENLNLSLNLVHASPPLAAVRHYGIEVDSLAAVEAAAQTMGAVGPVKREAATECCYAKQEKVWAVDPDGHKWEVFWVISREGEVRTPEDRTCGCAPECCR